MTGRRRDYPGRRGIPSLQGFRSRRRLRGVWSPHRGRRARPGSAAGPAALLLLIGGTATLAACAGATSSPATPYAVPGVAAEAEAAPVRGTIAVVGAAPMTRVVLQSRTGAQMVLVGDRLPSLRRLDGVDVRCDGRVEAGGLRVVAFRVVGVRGLPAADGILEIRDDAVVLVATDGTLTRYSPVPDPLRAWAGRRVWVAGAPDGAPEAWGLITPPN